MRSHASALSLILFFAVRCSAAPGCVPEELFDGLPQAPADLSRLLQKAGSGDREAQFRLGLAYDTGIGVKRDYGQAADWYRKAANSGNPGAQNNLAGLYSRGLGVPQSDVEAFRWYMRAPQSAIPPLKIIWASSTRRVAEFRGMMKLRCYGIARLPAGTTRVRTRT